jgi:hypothetical protein
MRDDNPYERYDLDPAAGPKAITARLRELAEETEDDLERARIRDAWEALTMHPMRRLDLALQAHPETRAAVGRPPRPLRWGPADPVTLDELVPLPSLAAIVGTEDVALGDLPLDADPILNLAAEGTGSSSPSDP